MACLLPFDQLIQHIVELPLRIASYNVCAEQIKPTVRASLVVQLSTLTTQQHACHGFELRMNRVPLGLFRYDWRLVTI